MVFFVNIAADVYSQKHNVRMEYASVPTISELINTVESQLDVTARASRPAGYPDIPFRVQTFQIYDDVLLRWVDLYSSAQLSSGCQVYAFQPDTVWNVDLQGSIPVARDSVSWSSAVGSPRRGVVAATAGVTATMSEKLRAAFYELDSGNKGYVLYTDLRSAFIRLDIDFSYATVGELFNTADRNGDGHISYEEWVRFALDHPNVVDALFFRSRDLLVSRPLHYTRPVSAAVERDAYYTSTRRAREVEIDRLYRESSIARDRTAAQSQYDNAKRDAELARSRATVAAESERRARDALYYTPSSPRSMYSRPASPASPMRFR